MLGIFAVITYLASGQTQSSRRRLLLTLASGFSVFLGGLSWEGFGVFVSLAFALGYVWMQLDTFASTTVPLSQNELMQTVGELSVPDYRYWVFRYGSLFFLGSLGFMSVGIRLWKNSGTVLAVFIFLFMLTTFFQARLETLLSASGCSILFFTSLVLLFIAWRQREAPKRELVYIAMAVWFLQLSVVCC